LFETVDCPPCDELHREAFRRPDVLSQIARFDFVRFEPYAATPLVAPDGRHITANAWARELGIAWSPSVVFFDTTGREVFRIDAYLRPFHVASSLEYVADRGYVEQPSFQRWMRARAEAMRRSGERVDIWN
ncbi:MAG: thioredoxin family protein, partial [Casimicrobiaceae bacterium]